MKSPGVFLQRSSSFPKFPYHVTDMLERCSQCIHCENVTAQCTAINRLHVLFVGLILTQILRALQGSGVFVSGAEIR